VIEETLFEAEEKMERAIEFAKDEFASIRTGRATPAMFARIMVDYYGSPTPVGVNPNNEGTQIRILIPPMTEERRREMIKVARHKGEESKVAIRNVRRKAKEELDRLVKDGETGEDDGRRAEKELDDLTHRFVASVDELLKHKETELLEV